MEQDNVLDHGVDFVVQLHDQGKRQADSSSQAAETQDREFFRTQCVSDLGYESRKREHQQESEHVEKEVQCCQLPPIRDADDAIFLEDLDSDDVACEKEDHCLSAESNERPDVVHCMLAHTADLGFAGLGHVECQGHHGEDATHVEDALCSVEEQVSAEESDVDLQYGLVDDA